MVMIMTVPRQNILYRYYSVDTCSVIQQLTHMYIWHIYFYRVDVCIYILFHVILYPTAIIKRASERGLKVRSASDE